MGSWLKLFADGTKEHGSDQEIARGNASWTLGRHEGIKEVRIFHKLQVCSLTVPNTSWHQFDRFSAIVSEGIAQSKRTHRVIQAEIRPHHVGLSLICSHTGGYYSWAIVQELNDSSKHQFFCKVLRKDHVGKWLTVVLPDGDYPGMTFSIKGKMYDNKHISR